MSEARLPAWRVLRWPAVATAVAFAILLSLGFWQLDRKSWKEGLLAAIQARAFGPPGSIVPEAGWPRWDPGADEFRRVRLAGTFRHDQEVAVHGWMEERRGIPIQGYYVFTPLVLADGSTIVVNRGFVPTPLRDASTRPEGQAPGEATVTGLVRMPQTRTMFVPENAPARGEWFVRDLGQMAAARGLARVAPFYVDADSTPNPGGWPRGGQTQINLPNNHLQYAITWFSLAGVLLAVFAVFARGRLGGAGRAADKVPEDSRSSS